MASYHKLKDGTWGVKGTWLKSGKRVCITRRNGAQRIETVGRILWEGPDGIQLATLKSTVERERGMVTELSSLSEGTQLYAYTLGRAVRISAVATSLEEVNKYLARNRNQSVIAQVNDVVFMAAYDDKGKKVKL